jgi:hypothetical protein
MLMIAQFETSSYIHTYLVNLTIRDIFPRNLATDE